MIENIMFCIWLAPSAPVYTDLTQQMDHLAAQYNAPTFRPHMTLFCGKTAHKQQMTNSVKAIAQTAKPITLSVTGIETSSQYYKSVFITLAPTATLTQLFQKTKQLDPQSRYELNPHMSLLYTDLPLSQKDEIAKSIKPTLPITITFDRIQVMSDTDQEGPEGVKSWQEWYSIPLK